MRRSWLALGLALALLCGGCAGTGEKAEEPPEGKYSVYFAVVENRGDSAALDREFRALPKDRETAEGLMALLLSGPESGGLASPFPKGTSLRSCRVEDGVARIDLSEAYEGLSGGALTLADGCVVLTLCQLEEIRQVYLTVEGRPRPFRDKVFSPSDFLLDNNSGAAREVEAELWFLRDDGLDRETRTLKLAPGDEAAIAVLQALLKGPEGSGMTPVCPEGTTLLSLEQEGTTFTVDLSGSWRDGEEDPRRLTAVVNTLDSLEPGVQVVFLVEGQRLETFGGVTLDGPIGAEKQED